MRTERKYKCVYYDKIQHTCNARRRAACVRVGGYTDIALRRRRRSILYSNDVEVVVVVLVVVVVVVVILIVVYCSSGGGGSSSNSYSTLETKNRYTPVLYISTSITCAQVAVRYNMYI